MGCDVHVYVEYRKPDDDRGWRSFGGHINPGRSYVIFGAMAGVRVDETDGLKTMKAKGMPDFNSLGWDSRSDYTLFITEDGSDSGDCSLADAERWAKDGRLACWGSDFKPCEKPILNGRIEGPDWHSHTWLTLREYRRALRTAKMYMIKQEWKWDEPEYEAIAAAMARLEREGYESRLVLWFDN